MDLVEKLANERRARLAAERLLEQKKRELFKANQQLAVHARALSDQVVAQREGLQRAIGEAETLKGENVRAQGEVVAAQSAAQSAQRRLWQALETVPDGFAVFDAKMRLVVANRAYLQLFDGVEGIEPGMTYDMILKIFATEGIVDLEGMEPVDWHHEMVARVSLQQIPAKTMRLYNGQYVKLIDRRGEDGDLVCLVQDITPMIQREAELREARDAAEAANRAKSAFLANMSHEIRTPMNGVVGMAELMCESDLSEEQRLYAETIKSSGEALLVIINDVLDYSKIEAEKMKLYPEPFDLERCIHEVLVLLQPSARDRGVKLLVDFDMFLPTRYVADPGRMRQVLTNLIGNAVKFTQEGHVLVRVVGVGAGDGAQELHSTVEDTGIGIAPEHIDHIFGEFNQVESQSNRKYEGTGLGLAITRQLIEMMGGSVWVESELGEGSCFGFKLPLPVAEEPLVETPAAPLNLRCALVVDDLLINRVILERQLQTYGMQVTLCRSGDEALRAVDETGTGFDIVLTDHEMPDMDGLELAEKLRERGLEKPILLLSSNPDRAQESAGKAAVAALLKKPILRSDLFRVLQEISGAAPEEPAPPQQAEPPAAPAPVERRQMRVLAAEDNRTNQLVFRKMVKEFDIELEFANNGREAVELYQSFRPDLVFMDISMPEMDGREATRTIRGIEATGGLARTPIVALTAHAMDGDSASIFEAGVDHYLTKPLKKAAIAERICAAATEDCRPPAPETVTAAQ